MEQISGVLSRLLGRPRAIETTKPDSLTPEGDPAVVAVIAAPPPASRGPFIWLVIAAVVVLWLARDVLGPFIVAAVVAYAFSPLVAAGQRRTGWPRIAVVGVGYGIAVAIIGVVVYLLAGRIAHEIRMLAASGPDSLATLLRSIVGSDAFDI